MMFGRARKSAEQPVPAGPVLDLSGPRLRRAFEHLVEAAEPTGGVERYVTALSLKAALFEDLFGRGKVAELTEAEFLDLCAFITPARRRVSTLIAEQGFDKVRRALVMLMDGWADLSTADARLEVFMAAFPEDKAHRFVRDLGAEVLHFTAPDRYPLMTRWMWDQKVGTGVIREIWFADDVDAAKIEVGDGFETFETLGRELQQFLSNNGVFRDLVFYADVLCAHIYAAYINDKGGQYLRSDFTNEGDAMTHTRRMLGLDAVDTESGRTRLKLIDGSAHRLGSLKTLPHEEMH